eukprot:gene1414-1978_t
MVTAASNLLAPVPKGLKHIKGALGGVPGEWLIPVNPKGALLYIHGGGFVAGHPPMYRPFCGALANALGSRVFMVDYRLAPEHKFPAAHDDALDAWNWLERHAGAHGIDPARLAAGGDSAGGTLAAVCAIQARAAGLPLALQLLFYPCAAATLDGTVSCFVLSSCSRKHDGYQQGLLVTGFNALLPTSPRVGLWGIGWMTVSFKPGAN